MAPQGKAHWKIGDSLIAGRNHVESALTVLNTFYLRRGMILNSRELSAMPSKREKSGVIRLP